MRKIIFLCDPEELDKERWGYSRAFAKHGEVICWGPRTRGTRGSDPQGDFLHFLERLSEKPRLILHPEASAFLPWGLTEVDAPTACFQIEVFAFPSHRILWSMLFDYACLFETGHEQVFKDAGHLRPVFSPHAVDAGLFQKLPKERNHLYEVGWVGHLEYPIYTRRRRIIHHLAEEFQMNEWWRLHNQEEMAEVYKHSKIVVNVNRDDYPEVIHTRVFEVMAAGALLVMGLPNHLTALGFQEGEHFVGFRQEQEVTDLVRYYLAHEDERRRIAAAGRAKTLREHTYDQRVEALLNLLEKDKGQLFAPARKWSERQIREAYLDYFAGHHLLDCTVEELGHLRRWGRTAFLKSLFPFAKSLLRVLRRAFHSET